MKSWRWLFVVLLAPLLFWQGDGVAAESGGTSKLAPLQALRGFTDRVAGTADDNEILPADQAFIFSADPPSATEVVLHWRITDGYYLYRDKIQVTAPHNTPGLTLGTPQLPNGEVKQDEFFGRVEIYKHDIEARVPLSRGAGTPDQVTLQVAYQGCATAGICYPPIIKPVTLYLSGVGTAPVIAASAPAVTGPVPVPEQDRIAQTLAGGHIWLTLLSFFGFGLLLAFTPCVFPMVPILSGLIVGQGAALSTARAFALSLAYVLAMALTYTVAGVFAGLFGANLQATFQNPWVLGAFSAVFVVLALSLFGFYELQVPSWLQGKLTDLSNRQRSGTLLGAAIMGLLSALIVGPCVAAPLAAALIYIGKSGDALLGGSALFMLSLGMGAPLLVLGTTAGKLLPKAGAWMHTVKSVFGVLLLAVAIWMLERVLPVTLTLSLWAALLIVSGVFMGALDRLLPDASGWRKFWKGIGLVIVFYGALLLVGATVAGGDVQRPLQGLRLGEATTQDRPAGLSFTRIKSIADLNNALVAARGKQVMLDFYADWCVSCKEMEKYTFSNKDVKQLLSERVLLQADVTANDADDRALLQHFGLIGPPSILFFSAEGRECDTRRVMGYLDPEQFSRFADNTAC